MAGTWAVTADDLRDIGTALKYEEDGVRLRRQMAKELREAAEPAVADAKGRLVAMGSAGLTRDGEPLRTAIASRMQVQARLAGKSAGVRIRVRKSGMPRGFRNAPMRTNRDAGWRHPVPPPRLPEGAEGPQRPPVWVKQIGAPGWFDDPMQERRAEFRAAVEKAVADMAVRIRGGT